MGWTRLYWLLVIMLVPLTLAGRTSDRTSGRNRGRTSERTSGRSSGRSSDRTSSRTSGRSSGRYREQVYMPYPKAHGYRQRVQCYQCAYSPAKTVYKTIKFPVEMKDFFGRYSKTKVIYRTKMVPLRKTGGWDKCMGPFSHYQAQQYGLDVWECDHNCYTRTDRNGNVFRGCYKGEFGVDPTKVGCSRQAGQLYCFCEGNKCNHGAASSYRNVGH